MATSKYYGFAYDPRALDYLKTVPKNIRRQIINKIQRLAAAPHPPTAKLVQGMSDDEERVYRIRSGDYRILYIVRGIIVIVLDIDHRKDVYR
jgi:mRNA-degrading endonuclease RelE of RelBE toxin-antitoxin system